MNLPLNILSERIDDIVLLLHVMMQMELPQLLNKHLPRHWKQEGLDWGWVIAIWLAYMNYPTNKNPIDPDMDDR
ncbi:MAG: hypothetical protein HC856_09530 [Pseudanabaena sp. RU_4_16]|nr:hypothetical protein [Pseudanabaena sp. RU_4_16]